MFLSFLDDIDDEINLSDHFQFVLLNNDISWYSHEFTKKNPDAVMMATTKLIMS